MIPTDAQMHLMTWFAEPFGSIAGRWHVTVDLTFRTGTQEVLGL